MASIIAGIVGPMLIEGVLNSLGGNGKDPTGSGIPKRTKKGIVYNHTILGHGRRRRRGGRVRKRKSPKRHTVKGSRVKRHKRYRT